MILNRSHLSTEQAAYLFRSATKQGHESAQYSLGLLYEHGQGVTQDLEMAEYWYQNAAAGGSTWAEEALNRLLTGLDLDE